MSTIVSRDYASTNNSQNLNGLDTSSFAEPDAPTDIHFANVTEDSAVILWFAPRAKISGYRLFLNVEGSNPTQLRLPARFTQYTLLNLKPDTVYTATLHSEQDNTLSEGERAVFTTSEYDDRDCKAFQQRGKKMTPRIDSLVLFVFVDPPMGNAPHFSTDITDTSIIISWTPVPRVSYKVCILASFRVLERSQCGAFDG